jgi:hypothetical protein
LIAGQLGEVPDVVTPVSGRLTALFKSTIEHAQPFDEALLGDLALEQQCSAKPDNSRPWPRPPAALMCARWPNGCTPRTPQRSSGSAPC